MGSLFDYRGNYGASEFVYLRGVRSTCDDFRFIVPPSGPEAGLWEIT